MNSEARTVREALEGLREEQKQALEAQLIVYGTSFLMFTVHSNTGPKVHSEVIHTKDVFFNGVADKPGQTGACPFCGAGAWAPTPTAGRLGCTSCGAVALPGRGSKATAHTPPPKSHASIAYEHLHKWDQSGLCQDPDCSAWELTAGAKMRCPFKGDTDRGY